MIAEQTPIMKEDRRFHQNTRNFMRNGPLEGHRNDGKRNHKRIEGQEEF